MKPSPGRNARLFKYQSAASHVVGVEVVVDVGQDFELLFKDLRGIADTVKPKPAPDFFVMELATDKSAELPAVAAAAAAHGLAGKLCFVVPVRNKPAKAILEGVQALDLRILLGGIDPDARFSDLTDSLVDGVVLDRGLIARAAGDPQAASVVEAIAALARSLGLRSFAHRCALQTDVDLAMSCGVNYLTLDAESELEAHDSSSHFLWRVGANRTPPRGA